MFIGISIQLKNQINRTLSYSEPFYSGSDQRIRQSQFLFQLAVPLVEGDNFHLCFYGIVRGVIDLRTNERELPNQEPATPSASFS